MPEPINRAERIRRNRDVVDQNGYCYIFSPTSDCFHRSDCWRGLSAAIVQGTIHYFAAAEKRRPCKICRPDLKEDSLKREQCENGAGDQTSAGISLYDCIYTPDVIVFKSDTDEPTLLPTQNWYPVDVITCAAPNLRERPSNSMNPGSGDVRVRLSQAELKALHIKRAKRIMEIAKRRGVQVLILGAFGCGAFQNPPQVVAAAYKEALIEYRYAFETVEFAIYCPPGRMENYDVFKRMLG